MPSFFSVVGRQVLSRSQGVEIFSRIWRAQRGWVRFFTLFVSGALGAFGFAPIYAWWCLGLSFTFCLLALDSASHVRQAGWIGWIWGWGYFTGGLYWISFSLGVEWTRFFWVLPFSLLGLPAILACFSALATGFAWLGTRPGVSRWLGFAAFWGGMEWLRGNLFTGFPWNLTAYSLGNCPELMQTAAWVGSYGLGVAVALTLSFPYVFLSLKRRFSRVSATAAVLVGLAMSYSMGSYRLNHATQEQHQGVGLRIVQPNISQKEKWSPQKRQENLERLVQLSLSPSKAPVTHLIWPEACVPFFLEAGKGFEGMPAFTTPEGAFLLGAPRRELASESGQPMRVWNSLWILGNQGQVLGYYDKSHLVPFGEYLPFRTFLEQVLHLGKLRKFTYGEVDFQAGPGLQTLSCPGAPSFSPLICYEAIFPGHVVALAQPRPSWLLNLTNDAWFGTSSGPYQHLDSCRFRAVEEGLPLVRAANTGISAVIDPYGRCLGQLSLNQTGVLDAPLPTALPPTPYSLYGEIFFLGFCGMLMLLAWGFGYRPRHSKKYL